MTVFTLAHSVVPSDPCPPVSVLNPAGLGSRSPRLEPGVLACLPLSICQSGSRPSRQHPSPSAVPVLFLRLFAAPRLEGSSPGAWPLPALQHLRGLGFSSPMPSWPCPSPQAPSDACLPPSAYSGTLCMSSAGCLSSQAPAASVFAWACLLRICNRSNHCYANSVMCALCWVEQLLIPAQVIWLPVMHALTRRMSLKAPAADL